MPSEGAAIIGRRRVRRQPVILSHIRTQHILHRKTEKKSTYPKHHRARLVARADLEVRALREVVEQEVEQVLGLLRAEADDVLREPLVDVQRLLPCDGMYAHERVLGLHGLAAHGAVALARELGLRDGGVHRAQALEALLEGRGEALVRLDLREEERVAAAVLRLVEDEEERRAWGLFLV